MNNCPTNLLFSSNYHVHIFLSYKIEITRRYTDYYNLYRSSTKVKHDIQLQDEYFSQSCLFTYLGNWWLNELGSWII